MKAFRVGIGIALAVGSALALGMWSDLTDGNAALLVLAAVLFVGPAAWTLFSAQSGRALVRALTAVGVISVALLTVLLGTTNTGRAGDDVRLAIGCAALAFMFLLVVWPFAVNKAHREEQAAAVAAEELARERHQQLLDALGEGAPKDKDAAADAGEELARERHQQLLDALDTPRCLLRRRLKKAQR